ncbi:lipoprotein LpqV [Mycobacterium sp. NAZ190054]|uniref:lipoprotein LpqV n=1 Tax=Mycobacterium sp. NAZ190054 TaxID=1747766 RepID=UPI0007973E6E|nr:lipoprotein LpqV [Mycobacterium sp. NAZ190054]KWX68005.1 hypothetical protein ASJ79_19485 [Mycobacterium sp. NAZ190054]
MSSDGPRRNGVIAVIALSAAILAGCSSEPEPAPTTTSPSSSPSSPQATAPPAGVGVSPGGVTTSVDAPADSTEDDYFQACRAARTWIDGQGGDPHAQIEPYLKSVQDAPTGGPGTFGKTWSELTPGQQSAVIVAVEAAADALCD